MSAIQLDLLAVLTPRCGDCKQLGDALESGVRYCHGEMTWRGPEERVEDCVYRDQPDRRLAFHQGSRAEALTDLLNSPRHSIGPKNRAWLKAELRREAAA